MLTNPLGGNLIMMEAVHATNYHNYNKKKHGKKIEDKTDAEAELKSLRESEMMESEIFIDKLNVWEGRK